MFEINVIGFAALGIFIWAVNKLLGTSVALALLAVIVINAVTPAGDTVRAKPVETAVFETDHSGAYEVDKPSWFGFDGPYEPARPESGDDMGAHGQHGDEHSS